MFTLCDTLHLRTLQGLENRGLPTGTLSDSYSRALVKREEADFEGLVVQYTKADAVFQIAAQILPICPAGYMSTNLETRVVHLTTWKAALI